RAARSDCPRHRDRSHAVGCRRTDWRPGRHVGRRNPRFDATPQRRVRQNDCHGHARPTRSRPRKSAPSPGERRTRRRPVGRSANEGSRAMKLLKYIWRNATRNKLRSSLTILSVGFSLALMTVLYGYLAMQGVWQKDAKVYNRIVVMNKQGLAGRVPIAYVERVRQAQNVKAAVPYQWYGGTYKDQVATFAQFGTDSRDVFKVWPELKIDPEQLSA